MEIILIGGPQSTGSSLLRQILNRHQDINCLNETHIFAKAALYDDWQNARHNLFTKRRSGLKTAGWHIFTGFDIGLDHKDSLKEIFSSEDYSTFYEFALAASKSLSGEQIKMVMDKTPANVFTMSRAFEENLSSKSIITIRDPYDTVASLVSRGKHLMDAVVLVKSALSAMKIFLDDERVRFIKYEDLVENPNITIESLCDFLNIDFDEQMLVQSKSNKESDTKIEGWTYDEGEAIKSGSLGRFEKLSQKKQNLIVKAFNMISWKGSNQSVWEVMKHFNYERKSNDMNVRVSFSLHLMRKLISHWLKNNPYHIFNNPITFSKNK